MKNVHKKDLTDLAQYIETKPWSKNPEDTTLAECRVFANENRLKLPKGLPQSKEAFVAMFVCCNMVPDKWKNEKYLKKDFPSLSNENRVALFAYRNALRQERNGKEGKPDLKIVSSTMTKSETITSRDHLSLVKKTSELPFPNNPKTGKPFESEAEWHEHNVTSRKNFDFGRMQKNLTGSKPFQKPEKKPSTPKTWPKRFNSPEEWWAHNQSVTEETAAKENAKKKTTTKKPVGFEESLNAALVAANSS